MDDKHWLQSFIEKNVWQVFVVGGGAILLASQVRANSGEIETMKQAIIGITENQTQILLIQQQAHVVQEDIEEIKDELKEIKNLVK